MITLWQRAEIDGQSRGLGIRRPRDEINTVRTDELDVDDIPHAHCGCVDQGDAATDFRPLMFGGGR